MLESTFKGKGDKRNCNAHKSVKSVMLLRPELINADGMELI